MKKIDMIVKSEHFYTMEGEGVGYKTGVDMLVDGGKILGFVDSKKVDAEYMADEVLDLSHHMVLPGFIDGHMHTSFNIMRGLAQDINYWMMYGLQPFDNALIPEASAAGSELAIVEAIKAGTTTLGDYDYSMEGVCRFIDKVGARGNIAHMIRAVKKRVYNPGELYEFDNETGEVAIAENIALYDRWHNKSDGRIRVLFGPQGADFVSADMLTKIQKIAK